MSESYEFKFLVTIENGKFITDVEMPPEILAALKSNAENQSFSANLSEATKRISKMVAIALFPESLE